MRLGSFLIVPAVLILCAHGISQSTIDDARHDYVANRVLEIAADRIGEFSPIEEDLLWAISSPRGQYEPDQGTGEAEQAVVSGRFLSWLLTEPALNGWLNIIELVGVSVEGRVVTVGRNVPYIVVLRECRMPSGIDISYSRLVALSLEDSTVGPIFANGSEFAKDLSIAETGSVQLYDNEGPIGPRSLDLVAARIGGSLVVKSKLKQQAPLAVNAERCQVHGSAILRGVSCSNVNIRDARVDASLELSGRYTSVKGVSILGERAQVGGRVQIGTPENTFTSDGMLMLDGSVFRDSVTFDTAQVGDPQAHDSAQSPAPIVEETDTRVEDTDTRVESLSLMSASIRGILIIVRSELHGSLDLARCELGSLLIRKETVVFGGPLALHGDYLDVKGAVVVSESDLRGMVRLIGADVGGNLELAHCTVKWKTESDQDEYAVDITGMRAHGALLLDRATVLGGVRMVSADLGGLSGIGFELEQQGGVAIAADRVQVRGTLALKDGLVEGALRLVNADVEHSLDLTGLTVDDRARAVQIGSSPSTEKFAVNAAGLVVGRDLRLDKATVRGGVCLRNSRLGDASFIAATLESSGRPTALTLENSVLTGSVRFDGGDLDGLVSLFSASVGRLWWTNLPGQDSCSLDLRGTHAVVLADEKRSWPDHIWLAGFTYEAIHDGAPSSVEDRLNWIRRSSYSDQPYEQLAAWLGSEGRKEDEKSVRVAKEVDSENGLFENLLGGFRRYTVGYGHRPVLLLAWFGAFVVLSWWYLFGQRERFDHTEAATAGRFPAFWYALDTCIPFVNLKESERWFATDRPMINRLNVMVLVGWFLATIGVLGLTRLL